MLAFNVLGLCVALWRRCFPQLFSRLRSSHYDNILAAVSKLLVAATATLQANWPKPPIGPNYIGGAAPPTSAQSRAMSSANQFLPLASPGTSAEPQPVEAAGGWTLPGSTAAAAAAAEEQQRTPTVKEGSVSIPMEDVDEDGLSEAKPPPFVEVSYWDITKEFSLMGFIAFGGPAAHIGLFQKRLVESKRWMSEQLFLELFALGGCLPGPTSTQVSFAMGTVKKGVLGGLLSGALFQYPGAVIMTALGIASARALQTPPDWLVACSSGVSAVGVALVASAAKGLLAKCCTDKDPATARVLVLIGVISAAAVIYWNSFPWLFVLVIFAGAVASWLWNWNKDCALKGDSDDKIANMGINMWGGAALFFVWAGILVPVLVLVRVLNYDHRVDDTPLDWFEVFYRTGSIIYGGGQVVLPLLLGDLVKTSCDANVQPPVCVDDPQTSWVTSLQFYTGLGLVQAMPGPLFNLSAYLGAIIAWNAGYQPLIGVVLAWFGLFSPGILLMFACLPYWQRFRKWNIYRRALPGMNAASVGLILASVFRMTLDVYALSPFPTAALCIGLWAFAAVDQLGVFEPLVVLGGILLGLLAWGAKMN